MGLNIYAGVKQLQRKNTIADMDLLKKKSILLCIVDGGNNPWKYVAFTLIGSITTVVAVGLIVFTRPWLVFLLMH